MITREDDGYWINLESTIAAHPEEVFACLATASGLIRWFPVSAEIEPRTGGTIVLGWDRNLQQKTTVAILEFDPGGKMTWDWHAAAHDRHAPVYWDVRPHRDSGAVVRLKQGPFMSDEESMVSMAEEAANWQWQLCNLRSVLESQHDMRKLKPL